MTILGRSRKGTTAFAFDLIHAIAHGKDTDPIYIVDPKGYPDNNLDTTIGELRSTLAADHDKDTP